MTNQSPSNKSYSGLMSQMQGRKDSIRKKMMSVVSENENVNIESVSNLAQIEIYNHLLFNEIISGELLQLWGEAKAMPFYKHEVKRHFKMIEGRRLEYQHYVKRVLSTNDGFFCDVADMYEEEVNNYITLIYVAIKQYYDNNGVNYSKFRARMECIKFLLYVSMDIYLEVCVSSEIVLGVYESIWNRNTNLSSILWSLMKIEEVIGANPEPKDENADKISDTLVKKIALGKLAMECFDKVREGIDTKDLPDWYPIVINSNVVTKQ